MPPVAVIGDGRLYTPLPFSRNSVLEVVVRVETYKKLRKDMFSLEEKRGEVVRKRCKNCAQFGRLK